MSFRILTFVFLLLFVGPSLARYNHVITFRSPDLFPESFTWDHKREHFIVGSLRHPTLLSVSDAGVADTLLSEPSIPSTSSFLGLAVDRRRNRLLVVVVDRDFSSPSLASFDLTSNKLQFLTPLIDPSDTASAADDINNPIITTVTSDAGASLNDGKHQNTAVAKANDVTTDSYGNAYVTSSTDNIIWKINLSGEASILSKSQVFKSHHVDPTLPYHKCGLNGIIYTPKGYLLVVQSNTGKLFKVDMDTGVARTVLLNKDIIGADGIAIRKDGVLLIINQEKLFFLKSDNSWSEGVVFDETTLDVEKQASAVAVGAEDRVYVLYGYINEGMIGNIHREEFSIVQIESEKERKDENIWMFVLIGMGLAYFLFWRFQMRNLMKGMNKKLV